jgi:hypothetical protein
MKQFIGFMTLAGVACIACSGSAQSRRPAVEPGPEITIIGCVQPTDTSTPAGRTADTKYMLTNAHAGNASGTSSTGGAAGTSGTAGTTGTTAGTSGSSSRSSAPVASMYQLDAKDATIAPEVGHQVEIVAVAPDPDPSGKTPKLKVETIKFVAATCPPL